MIETMIPDLYWDNESWSIKKVNSLDDALKVLKFCDGSVKNIVIDCKETCKVQDRINELFDEINWINKLLIKRNDKLIGIYQKN